jgi:hypothetical protein
MKLSQMQGTIEQRVCLFGPPKVGKTLLAGMLAKKYKLLVFMLENGHSVLTQVPEEFHDRIEIIVIRDSKDYPIAIETMLKVVKGKEVFICHKHSKVSCPICTKNCPDARDRICLDEVGLDTIVIYDSLTQLTQSALAHITKSQPDDYKCQLDDWGNLKLLMEKFMSAIQVATYNCVAISHEEEVKFEDGRTKIVPVAGSSNSSRNTAKYFDHVVYCNVVNKKHVVGSATDYSTSVLTGSRTNVKLEANKEGGDLLEIFTNWKLPNYGMKLTEDVTKIDIPNEGTQAQVIANIKVAEAEVVKSPAQIALDNLRNKVK